MRPIRNSKSNYFVLHMGEAAEFGMKDKIIELMSVKWQKAFVEYAVEEWKVYVNREIDISADIRKGFITHDFEYLISLIEKDKNRKYPTNKLIFLECFVVQFLRLHMAGRIKIDRDLDDWFGEKTFDFYINNVFASKGTPKSSSLYNTLFIEEELLSIIKQLIVGYEIYLKEIEKGTKSKTSICDFIETKILSNRISNVRQEFDRHDKYFNKFEGSNPEFEIAPNKLKIELLLKCLSFTFIRNSLPPAFNE